MMQLSRDGLREIVLSTAILGTAGLAAVWAAFAVSSWAWLAAVPLLAAWLGSLAFFRDPERDIPGQAGLLVSPADGTVTEIRSVERYDGIDGPALRIGIFLSLFDVHVNRAPCSGRVLKTEYRPGRFLDARHPESGLQNEANTITIQPESGTAGPIILRQITGLIARRIVCHLGPGDTIRRGQRIGLLKFGSRTELIVPAKDSWEPAVRLGDHVCGGSTILMQLAANPRQGDADRRGGLLRRPVTGSTALLDQEPLTKD